MAPSSKKLPSSVTAHILDPESGYSKETWTVGQHVPREVVERLAEGDNLFVVVAYEAGTPNRMICKRDIWDQTKSEFEAIDAQEQASEAEQGRALHLDGDAVTEQDTDLADQIASRYMSAVTGDDLLKLSAAVMNAAPKHCPGFFKRIKFRKWLAENVLEVSVLTRNTMKLCIRMAVLDGRKLDSSCAKWAAQTTVNALGKNLAQSFAEGGRMPSLT